MHCSCLDLATIGPRAILEPCEIHPLPSFFQNVRYLQMGHSVAYLEYTFYYPSQNASRLAQWYCYHPDTPVLLVGMDSCLFWNLRPATIAPSHRLA